MTSTLEATIARRDGQRRDKALSIYMAALDKAELSEEEASELEEALDAIALTPADFAAAVQVRAQLADLRAAIPEPALIAKLADQLQAATNQVKAARGHLRGAEALAEQAQLTLSGANAHGLQCRDKISRLERAHFRILRPLEQPPAPPPEPRVVQTFAPPPPPPAPKKAEPITESQPHYPAPRITGSLVLNTPNVVL